MYYIQINIENNYTYQEMIKWESLNFVLGNSFYNCSLFEKSLLKKIKFKRI